jgi:hypothetical protein
MRHGRPHVRGAACACASRRRTNALYSRHDVIRVAYLVVKVVVSALLVVAVSELARRSSFLGALLASLPVVSVLAFVWLYVETGDAQRVAELAAGILWLVIPSLVLFVLLPVLLRSGYGFWPSLAASLAATAASYLALVRVLSRLGVEL